MNGGPLNRLVVDHSAEFSIEESGSLGNDANASASKISHVVTFNLLFQTNLMRTILETSGLTHTPLKGMINQRRVSFFLPNTSEDINTQIDMESSQTSEIRSNSQLPDNSEAENIASSQIEAHGRSKSPLTLDTGAI